MESKKLDPIQPPEEIVVISTFYSKVLVKEGIILHVLDDGNVRIKRSDFFLHDADTSLVDLVKEIDYSYRYLVLISDPSRRDDPREIYSRQQEGRLIDVGPDGSILSSKMFEHFPAVGVIDRKLLI